MSVILSGAGATATVQSKDPHTREDQCITRFQL